MTTKPYDPLDGVNTKTGKDELMERLRKASAWIRRHENGQKKQLAEVEERLRAKGQASGDPERLKQAIISSTEEEWTELIEFLEEFEDLAPILAQRIIIGGRMLLGQIPAVPDPVEAPAT